MLNRLYTALDKSLFCDIDGILVGAVDFLELVGEIDAKTFEKIKVFFPHSNANFFSGTDCKRHSVFKREGRGDKELREVNDVLALLKKTDVKVLSGREFYFKNDVDKVQIEVFVKENVNPYVYDIVNENVSRISWMNAPVIEDFCQADYTELAKLQADLELRMGIDDLMCVQNYFISESREPTFCEIKIVDSFFSENFRHTTFETILDDVISDDDAVEAAWERYLEIKKSGRHSLSDIIKTPRQIIEKKNVAKATKKLCGVKVETQDENDEFLLVIKNETHNKSTTAVPYDGAASCVSGAVKDVLCAFGYAYDSHRVTVFEKNEKGRKTAQIASAGYAESASVIGVPISKCKETVSKNAKKKREICSLLAVTNAKSTSKVLEKEPMNGDKIYILGGKTGFDGPDCRHTNLRNDQSVGEYVPVSNPGELAALQRLFMRPNFADIVVAVNDVGSGGIVCALGEIIEGADINAGEINYRYGGVDAADAMLSESSERMIVCVRNENASRFEELCKKEGLDFCCIGAVNDDKRFVITDENGAKVASLTSEFLLSGGAEKHLSATVSKEDELAQSEALAAANEPLNAVNPIKKLFGHGITYDFQKACLISAENAEVSKSEALHVYDRSSGGDFTDLDSSVLARDISLRRLSYNGRPVIGKNGKPVYSALACGTLPEISAKAPFKGAYLSVVDSVMKLVAAGYGEKEIHLAMQEYFPEHQNSSRRLGVSVASMLGCFDAQMELSIPSIGGRISIANSEFDDTPISAVCSFAFCLCEKDTCIPSAFTKSGNKVVLIEPETRKNALPSGEDVRFVMKTVKQLTDAGVLKAAMSVNAKNPCSVIMQMCRAGEKGVVFDPDCDIDSIFANAYASVICELSGDAELPKGAVLLGYVSDDFSLSRNGDIFDLSVTLGTSEKKLSGKDGKRYIFLKKITDDYGSIKPVNESKVKILIALTRYSVAANDVKAAFEDAGAEVKIFALNDKNISEFVKNIKKSDVLWFGDSVGGTGFLRAVLADKKVRAEIDALTERKGLIYGGGSAFEVLLDTGLLDTDSEKIRHEKRDVKINEAVRVTATSRFSPFSRAFDEAEEYLCYDSGSASRLVCDEQYADLLARDGRIITQFSIGCNAPDCDHSIDSICSKNGLVLGQISRIALDTMPIVQGVMKYFLGYK